MRKALRILVTVVLVSAGILLVGLPEADAGTCGDNAGGPYGEGGLYGRMGNAGKGCHRHHTISGKTLEDTKNVPMPPHHPTGHGVGKHLGPAVRTPIPLHEDYTPNWGPDGEEDRAEEGRDIREVGLSEANKRAIERFIERLKDAVSDGEITQEEYEVIVKGLRDAQRDLDEYLEEGGEKEPPHGQEEGETQVRNPGEGNPPASEETFATVDDEVVAKARGLPGAWTGQEFDLVMADAAELAKPPEEQRRVIISADAAVVTEDGEIPEAVGSLHTSYGETGGELADFAPAAGTARVWFGWSSDHRVRATAPAEVTVYPAPDGERAVYPREQQADAQGQARWVVTAPEGEEASSAGLCYGDGACETRTVPAGEHSTALGFSHVFEQPGTYQQDPRVVGTAASDWAATRLTRVAGACPGTVPRAGFPDVEGGTHAVAIDCVAWWQVAAGDAEGHFQPGGPSASRPDGDDAGPAAGRRRPPGAAGRRSGVRGHGRQRPRRQRRRARERGNRPGGERIAVRTGAAGAPGPVRVLAGAGP